MPEFAIGTFVFATKTQARNAVRAVLNQTECGVPLSGEQFDLVLSVLMLHPSVDDKVGCGVKTIEVGTTDYGTRGFRITRRDDTQEFFSYLECLSQSTHTYRVMNAFRHAIADQIQQARDASRNCGHVHHVFPFAVLVKLCLGYESKELEDVETYQPRGEHGDRLVDERLKKRWQWFHKHLAVLEVVSPQEHKRIHHKPTEPT